MAKKAPPADSATPAEYPQTTPRDLHPTTGDIRLVSMEIGKLSAHVERLISDVKSHGEKIDVIRHQATFIKGGVVVGTVLISAFIAIATFFLSSKWDAAIQALRALTKP